MIRLSIDPRTLVAGRESELTIRLANDGAYDCLTVVLTLDLPGEIALAAGSEHIEMRRLKSGASEPRTIRVRPKRPGRWVVTCSNFSYTDARGYSVRIEDWHQTLVVSAPEPTPAELAEQEAKRHALAGRWGEAWPAFLLAGQVENARKAVARAAEELVRKGLTIQAADIYRRWAETRLQQVGQAICGDRLTAQWLDQAVLWYRAHDLESEEQLCRKLIAFIKRSPELVAEWTEPGGVSLQANQPNDVRLRLKNSGSGPARRLHVHLTALNGVVHPADHALGDLAGGHSSPLQALSVIPTGVVPCKLLLRASYLLIDSETPTEDRLEIVAEVVHRSPIDEVLRAMQASGRAPNVTIVSPGAISYELNVDNLAAVRSNLFPAAGPPKTRGEAVPDSRPASASSECSSDEGATGKAAHPKQQPVTCAKCSAESPAGAKFCMACGFSLVS